MIQISNVKVEGFESAIRGMRNPMNSWDRSDSRFEDGKIEVGANDHTLMEKLSLAGTEHAKYLRFIVCYADINAPLYWWKEFDTYRMGVEKNSCSTMHKIHAKEFTLDDFSHEHLFGYTLQMFEQIVKYLNLERKAFIETKNKLYWWNMIQLLPSSYNQKRTCMISYQALANMYKQRKNHKLDEWIQFCAWIETLPYSELITGEYEE